MFILRLEAILIIVFFNNGYCQNIDSKTNSTELSSLDSVKFCFFSIMDILRFEMISWNKSASLDRIKYFDNKYRTIIIIHGFNDGIIGSVMIPMLIKAFSKRGKFNKIVVEWSELARAPFYLSAARYSFSIGLKLGDFLRALKLERGLNLNTTEIVGFSLGAHIAGIASSVTRVSRVIGLDPSEVLFSETSAEYRLDLSDAPIVEVVHTTGGVIGFQRPLGNRDWYPNGGTYPQPGCSIADLSCSHSRAYKYFAEAIITRGKSWRGISCSSYEEFLANQCSPGIELTLGNNNKDESISGNFYLRTNSDKPYGKKTKSVN